MKLSRSKNRSIPAMADGSRSFCQRAAHSLRKSRSNMFFGGISVLGFSALATLARPANAAVATATMAISATVTATCTVATTPLIFTAYTGVLDQTTGTISVTCTNTTPYNIGLDAGTTAGATIAARLMTLAGATLGYGLFTDPVYATNWTNNGLTDTAGLVGTGVAVATNIYGQIPAAQFVAPGTYTDLITATITY